LVKSSTVSAVFSEWIKAINKITEGEVIALDGKTLRHSYDEETREQSIW